MRESGELALLAGAVLAGGVALWFVLRKRPSAAEKERLRRLTVNRNGRMADGNITDVDGEIIYFSYRVRGVEYIASQDVSALRDRVPADLAKLIGPVTAKYLPGNPIESIVVCEEWAGFRA